MTLIDAAIALREKVAALQTGLQGWNRQRKEHQASGKRKLSPEEREAHNAEGRRIKQEAGAVEAQLADAEAALREAMLDIPNLVHPDVPVISMTGSVETGKIVSQAAAPMLKHVHVELGGKNGIIVLDDQTDMVDALLNLMKFYAHESCGQCTPCREGTPWIVKILQRIMSGGSTNKGLYVVILIVNIYLR